MPAHMFENSHNFSINDSSFIGNQTNNVTGGVLDMNSYHNSIHIKDSRIQNRNMGRGPRGPTNVQGPYYNTNIHQHAAHQDIWNECGFDPSVPPYPVNPDRNFGNGFANQFPYPSQASEEDIAAAYPLFAKDGHYPQQPQAQSTMPQVPVSAPSSQGDDMYYENNDHNEQNINSDHPSVDYPEPNPPQPLQNSQSSADSGTSDEIQNAARPSGRSKPSSFKRRLRRMIEKVWKW